MQNLNTNEMTGRGVIVLNVSEMPQENISVGKGKNYLLVGDNSVWLKKIPNNSIDSIVTDPPAGISFMARGWDSDKGGRDNWIAWMCEVATECKRVLKPGGHAFVWAIPRTSHWTATAWENAGFEIRDVVAHIFGSGFPKSANIQKHLQKIGSERAGEFSGCGSALKPAREDWILMRKPLEKGLTIAENVLKYGTGGLNIDGCRVGTEEITTQGGDKFKGDGIYNKYATCKETTHTGRWPANLIHDGSEEVLECFPETKQPSFRNGDRVSNNDGILPWNRGRATGREVKGAGYSDIGSAARFFKECKYTNEDLQGSRLIYQAKASKKDRDEGLEGFRVVSGAEKTGRKEGSAGLSGNKEKGYDVNPYANGSSAKNFHPTVKPTALMRYLVKLVTPPGGTVLDPFTGSGSTGKACKLEGFDFIGIEREEEYVKIAEARIAAVTHQPTLV